MVLWVRYLCDAAGAARRLHCPRSWAGHLLRWVLKLAVPSSVGRGIRASKFPGSVFVALRKSRYNLYD